MALGWGVRVVVRSICYTHLALRASFVPAILTPQVFQLTKLYSTSGPLCIPLVQNTLSSPIYFFQFSLSHSVVYSSRMLPLTPQIRSDDCYISYQQYSFMVLIMFVIISQFVQLLGHCLPTQLDCGCYRAGKGPDLVTNVSPACRTAHCIDLSNYRINECMIVVMAQL